MRLTKRTYVKNWEHQTPDERHTVIVKLGGKVRGDIKPERIFEIVEELGTWRKANQIHNWFVREVQGGVDDCGEYYVEKDKLKELLDACKRVLAGSKLVKGKVRNGYEILNGGKRKPIIEDGEYIKDATVAKDLLPTEEGFFFGSQDYNEWYLDDIKLTIKILEEALLETVDYFYYSSSW